MPKGMTKSHGSSGENISHFNAVRMRVIGQGSLKLTMHSMQSIRTKQLVDIPMSMQTNKQPIRLANFMEQRAALEISTNSINDYFRINRIIVFSREVFTEYPA